MESLPTELLSSIFSFACTDGGYTGASLSAVSTHIRAISFEHALYTVSLHQWRQIDLFSTFLDMRAPDGRYVHHLLMTDQPSAWLAARVCIEDVPSLKSDLDMNTHAGTDVEVDASTKLVLGTPSDVEQAYSILVRLGPTLRTLTLLLFNDESSPSAGKLVFPLLEELTVHSSFFRAISAGSKVKSDSYEGSPRQQVVYNTVTQTHLSIPTLRRLHIVQNDMFDSNFVQQVSALAPQLAHLRLSEMSCTMFHNGNLVRTGVTSLVARGPCAASDNGQDGGISGPGFPATLERLLLQFHDEDTRISADWTSSTPSSAYHAAYLQTQMKSMLSLLRQYIQLDTEKRIVVLLPYASDGVQRHQHRCMVPAAPHYADIEESWKERASGGEGIWEVNDANVLLTHGYYGANDRSTLLTSSR